jgi:mRNA-degrading endonuclease toxin of MazEF toxin-antitoxin module
LGGRGCGPVESGTTTTVRRTRLRAFAVITIIVSTPSAGPNSVAVCDQVRAVDKRRLTRSEGQLSAVDLRSIEDSLRRVLEL